MKTLMNKLKKLHTTVILTGICLLLSLFILSGCNSMSEASAKIQDVVITPMDKMADKIIHLPAAAVFNPAIILAYPDEKGVIRDQSQIATLYTTFPYPLVKLSVDGINISPKNGKVSAAATNADEVASFSPRAATNAKWKSGQAVDLLPGKHKIVIDPNGMNGEGWSMGSSGGTPNGTGLGMGSSGGTPHSFGVGGSHGGTASVTASGSYSHTYNFGGNCLEIEADFQAGTLYKADVSLTLNGEAMVYMTNGMSAVYLATNNIPEKQRQKIIANRNQAQFGSE